jgi:serine/threonine protein kinase
LTGSRKQRIVIGVLSALLSLHHHTLCHGNLNPDNSRLDQDQFPHLVSYGLNGIGMVAQAPIRGTRELLAPESLQGAPRSADTVVCAFGMLWDAMFSDLPPDDRHQIREVSE